MTTTTKPNPFEADMADEMIAGIDFPTRRPIVDGHLVRWDRSAAAWLEEIRHFWLMVANGHVDLAAKGCHESIGDARDALAKAAAVTPA